MEFDHLTFADFVFRRRVCLHKLMVTLCEGGKTQQLIEYPFVNLQDEVNVNVMIKDKPAGQVRAQVRKKCGTGSRKVHRVFASRLPLLA